MKYTLQNPAQKLLSCFQDPDAMPLPVSTHDWNELLALARLQAVTPWLYMNIGHRNQVPSDVQETLRDAYYRATAHHIRMQVQLSELLSLLHDANQQVILLKGGDLADRVYPAPGLRPMTDLDLLVQPNQLQAVKELLQRDGYHPEAGAIGSSRKHIAPMIKTHALPVELHYHLAEPPLADSINISDVWARAMVHPLAGQGSLCLCPEDLILYLVCHTCLGHGFDNGILPFVDMQQILRTYHGTLNWDTIRCRAQEWKITRALALFLNLFARLLDNQQTSAILSLLPSVSPDLVDTSLQLVMTRSCKMGDGIAQLFLHARTHARTISTTHTRKSFQQKCIRGIRMIYKHQSTLRDLVFHHRAFRQRLAIESTRRDVMHWLRFDSP